MGKKWVVRIGSTGWTLRRELQTTQTPARVALLNREVDMDVLVEVPDLTGSTGWVGEEDNAGWWTDE